MDFSEFEKQVGVAFQDKALLALSFTHRSYVNENKHVGEHNERLEFLGDAVLQLAVTDKLFNEYKGKPEGELTAYRAALVNAMTLGRVAEGLGMNEYLLLSKGETKDTGRARTYILANTYEAFVGALYLDQGYDVTEKFILDSVYPELPRIIKEQSWRDAKSRFQEEAQEHVGETPTYELIKEKGPDHDKEFTVGVTIGGKVIAEGSGPSKQEAEQAAAQKALEESGWM